MKTTILVTTGSGVFGSGFFLVWNRFWQVVERCVDVQGT